MSDVEPPEEKENDPTGTEEEEQSTCTEEEWKAVRELLKSALLANEIPLESTEMRPKAVWQKYMDVNNPDIQCIDYQVKSIRDKYTRVLRALRKKHKNGDLEHEDKPKRIEWAKSAAKQFLKKCFREKVISTKYQEKQDEEQIWKDHCEGHPGFARMEFNGDFTRRLASVRDDYKKKLERCEKDQQAHIIAKQNHPTPTYNSRGEPQWNGSVAQKLLKELIAKGEHTGKKPEDIREKKREFKVYSKQVFRDHIYQEQRLLKFNNYVDGLRKRKFDELQY